MVQQRGEPFLLSLLCSFSYTFKPLGHAFPARSQSPARVLLYHVPLCSTMFPLVLFLGSTSSAPSRPGLFAGFLATTKRSDFSCPCFIGFDSSPSRCGPLENSSSGQARDLPVPVQRVYVHARG